MRETGFDKTFITKQDVKRGTQIRHVKLGEGAVAITEDGKIYKPASSEDVITRDPKIRSRVAPGVVLDTYGSLEQGRLVFFDIVGLAWKRRLD